MSRRNVMLVDVSNLAYRTHFVAPELATKDGIPTSVLHGVLKYVLHLHRHFPKTYFIFCFDGGVTWRHSYHKQEYKSTREPSEHRSTIYKQIPTLKKMLVCLGFKVLQVSGLEADDLIGILATSLEKKKSIRAVFIYSGDRDFFQLLTDKIRVVRAQDRLEKMRIMTPEDLKKEYGIGPDEWVKMRSLSGDSSDHIKPVKGVAKKIALKLILTCGIDASLRKFKQHHRSSIEKLKHTSGLLHDKIKEHWKDIHAAHVLSAIPRTIDNKRFSSEIKAQLSFSLPIILKEPGRSTEIDKKQFLSIAADHELEYIISKRNAFLTID